MSRRCVTHRSSSTDAHTDELVLFLATQACRGVHRTSLLYMIQSASIEETCWQSASNSIHQLTLAMNVEGGWESANGSGVRSLHPEDCDELHGPKARAHKSDWRQLCSHQGSSPSALRLGLAERQAIELTTVRSWGGQLSHPTIAYRA